MQAHLQKNKKPAAYKKIDYFCVKLTHPLVVCGWRDHLDHHIPRVRRGTLVLFLLGGGLNVLGLLLSGGGKRLRGGERISKI